MTALLDIVHAVAAQDPEGGWLRRLFEQLPEVHWGALQAPGALSGAPGAREVTLVDGAIVLPCVIETDRVVVAIEDARLGPLPTGTPQDPKRHHVARCIEALRVLARAPRHGHPHADDKLFGVIVVAPAGFAEPHRTTILEGLPHIEREQAEDLYANYWGTVTPEQLGSLASAPLHSSF